jgi:hypothetical protein
MIFQSNAIFQTSYRTGVNQKNMDTSGAAFGAYIIMHSRVVRMTVQ